MIKIINAKVLDETGQKFIRRDVLIENSRIYALKMPGESAENDESPETIDAKGCLVAPGFIDVHSHGDLSYSIDSKSHPKLSQGVTSEIAGNCGLSLFPLEYPSGEEFYRRYKVIWGMTSDKHLFPGFREYIEAAGFSNTNLFSLTGYSTLRYAISAFSSRALDKKEAARICAMAEKELVAGSPGISFGISYIPNVFAAFDEYREMMKIAKKHDKLAVFHMRNEARGLKDSVRELMDINKGIDCKLHISHLKNSSGSKETSIEDILEIIDDYSKTGSISFDVYPYEAGSTLLSALLPPGLLKMQDAELREELKKASVRKSIREEIADISYEWAEYMLRPGRIFPSGFVSEKFREYEGRSLEEISLEISADIIDLLCDIIIEEGNDIVMLVFAVDEEDIKTLLRHPLSLVGSDGLYNSRPHPRLYGTFTKFLKRYCIDEQLMSIEKGISKISHDAAVRFTLKGKSKIAPGYDADITIIDPSAVKDCATFKEPEKHSEGILAVIKGGELKLHAH